MYGRYAEYAMTAQSPLRQAELQQSYSTFPEGRHTALQSKTSQHTKSHILVRWCMLIMRVHVHKCMHAQATLVILYSFHIHVTGHYSFTEYFIILETMLSEKQTMNTTEKTQKSRIMKIRHA
jgi:hypothetical protein